MDSKQKLLRTFTIDVTSNQYAQVTKPAALSGYSLVGVQVGGAAAINYFACMGANGDLRILNVEGATVVPARSTSLKVMYIYYWNFK